ncbi:hypothetical protein DHB64_14580 [Antarcticibacterium sp. W02-3]|nr:hypothetical protein [Antarcticibacterium sp. W02-3]
MGYRCNGVISEIICTHALSTFKTCIGLGYQNFAGFLFLLDKKQITIFNLTLKPEIHWRLDVDRNKQPLGIILHFQPT